MNLFSDSAAIVSGVLIFAPIVTFLITLIDYFDIAYSGSDAKFNDMATLVQAQKVVCLQLIMTPDNATLNDRYFSGLVEKIDTLSNFGGKLRKCRFLFDGYYISQIFITVIGVVSALVVYWKWPHSYVSFLADYQAIIVSVIILYLFLAALGLFFKKFFLKKSFEKIRLNQ